MPHSQTTLRNHNHPRTLNLESEEALLLVRDLLEQGLSIRIRVSGISMRPFLMGNEVVTMGKVPVGSLNRGDIVFFLNDTGKPVLHRIIRLKKNMASVTVRTKGDGLIGFDPPIDAARILARVHSIEREGNIPGIDLNKPCQRIKSRCIVLVQLLRQCFYQTVRAKNSLLHGSKQPFAE